MKKKKKMPTQTITSYLFQQFIEMLEVIFIIFMTYIFFNTTLKLLAIQPFYFGYIILSISALVICLLELYLVGAYYLLDRKRRFKNKIFTIIIIALIVLGLILSIFDTKRLDFVDNVPNEVATTKQLTSRVEVASVIKLDVPSKATVTFHENFELATEILIVIDENSDYSDTKFSVSSDKTNIVFDADRGLPIGSNFKTISKMFWDGLEDVKFYNYLKLYDSNINVYYNPDTVKIYMR